MATDVAAEQFDLEPGDRFVVQGATPQEIDEGSGNEVVESTIVGIVRTPGELLPNDGDGHLDMELPLFHARPAWTAAHGDVVPSVGYGIGVWLDDVEADVFVARLRERLGDQRFYHGAPLDEAVLETIVQAVGYEVRAALGVAAVAALGVAFFVGQAVGRQARREASDSPILVALGMTRAQLRLSGLCRWLPVALAAAVIGASMIVAASTLGPVGIARRGPWGRGIYIDVAVLAVAVIGIIATVIAGGVAPHLSGRRAHRHRRVITVSGPPPIATGVVLAVRSLGRGGLSILSAVAGTAVAVGLVVAATAGVATIHTVTSSPVRYGATWDALVGAANSSEDEVAVQTKVRALPGIEAAATLAGATLLVGDEQLWVQAFVPIDGVRPLRPVIIDGREPTTADEIAIGTVAMERAGVPLGDAVELRSPTGDGATRYVVVGTTMVTDGYEPNIGIGAVVTAAGLDRVAPGAAGNTAVNLVDYDGRDEALTALRQAFPDTYLPVDVPSSIVNLERIASLPSLLAITTAVLAIVTLTHALLTAVRRQRRELAVYKALGFTRRQISGTVAAQATTLAVAAVDIGIPLGLIAARWGWRAIADGLGVATAAVVPPWIVAACVAGVLLLANLVAIGPGWLAGRIHPAEALHTE